ncbi:CHASE2 domain-containing protein [Laspinema olomoucense]|uniref:CHASE2 domain-containing protein n=1 Tax=Laspinema olomoucense TaxID=3231600 RepID=UPI0021BABA3C|nr:MULTISPECIES: adenylate/guanylate cyclase domain-containing protein [unclassified Laspinema]MCT7972631.1 adenylate/guanylate cyclase domain-containing protein [Laspinema sp. D3d]MCT7990180.1 adenylate/guanylate cyclase domain-containing protein [Laspinema sp. D3a]MCT7995357.1 adenylate/guanylate cyclase domain-containing protein [Laspinema sp. D3c]
MGFRHWLQGYLRTHPPLLPGAIAAAISVTMGLGGAWQPLERLGYGVLFNLRPELRWNPRITVIAIDGKSLQDYGQFPWSRDRYVELLNVLNTSSPTAIGFDILFLDPSPQDESFARAIQANGKTILASAGPEEEPLPVLKDAAAAIGHILHEPDSDGISRQGTVWLNGIPTLSLAMLQVSENQHPETLLNQISPQAIVKPDPEFDFKNVWINWPGKIQQVPTYSFVDVVEGRVPPDAFDNQLVLVGFVATGIDRKISPIQPITGVYIHAAILDNGLEGRFLKRLPPVLTGVILIGISLCMSWVWSDRGLMRFGLAQLQIAAALGFPLAWFAIALAAFTWGNWWLPVAAPIGTMLLAGIIVQLRDRYEKQQLMQLFAKQISPEMARLVWDRRDEIFDRGDLPPQELIATVLFMDIRSFTTISERLPPRDLLSWLNDYLDAMSECIMEHGGVIDKYIGDAIMAVFGLPFPRQTPEEIQADARNAIAACLAMDARLKQLNQRMKAEGKPLIQVGMGIHTGPLIAGSVGGKQRANYSAIGDTVNVAARVEPLNKDIVAHNLYHLLVTEETYNYVCDRYQGVQVTELHLRGKQQETIIYSILGERTDENSPNPSV